jgi:hypothetical protein
MLEQLLKELEETWGYTTEELSDIRTMMKLFATTALLDKNVAAEAAKVEE